MSTACTGHADAQPWRHVLTARDNGERLAEQPSLRAGAPAPGLARVWVDPGRRFQALLGFGGAFTEAAAATWQRLPAAARETLLRAYFHPTEGHGYTLCRVHMNSCDFALGHYAHADVPGDVALGHFSIERDHQALLPFIQAAQRMAGRPLTILASPWSPPAWMKTNGQMAHGGQLRPECRDAWAHCYARFIQAYADAGVPIWGVTVQNEPAAVQRWDSCIYSAEDERDFVRDHLGPVLAAAGLGHVKIVVWDHNRDLLVERASVIYNDPEAARHVWGAGFHWYGEEHFDHVQLLHDAWPDKQLLFTEGCQEGGPHTGEWALAERYGRALVQDLNRWTAGWIDWNLLLDETGGPNHVGNLCSAPILADTARGVLMPQSSYAALGQVARFVAPGARRVLCAATREALEATAALNPDGSVAVVVLNRSEHPIPFELHIAGEGRGTHIPAHAMATFVVPAAGGSASGSDA
jgi:glucosylceramidase